MLSLKKLDGFPKSLLMTLNKTDYSQWQRYNATKKATPSIKVFLPPVAAESAKKEDEKTSPSKPRRRMSGNKYSSASHSKNMRSRRERNGQHKATRAEVMLAKSAANIRLLQRFSKSKLNSLEELKRHSRVLLKKNQQLRDDIQEKDADTARCARDLLQQYDMFGTIITTLQDSSQNQVGGAKAELHEAENMVEKNMGKLELELSRMNAKVRALQEELNVLRTYMDKEYPVKSVQIASLMRSIKHLSEEQQDELEEAQEMAKQFLEMIVKRTKEETEQILQAVVEEKVSEYREGLQQMAKNNHELQQQIQMQKKIINDLGKEIEVLQQGTVVLHQYIRHPRDVIFQDVLLQRPICSPDAEIVLSIPSEEDFPL
ncbi:uncharacterized protein C20orf96 homolog [Paroedura picta]|uniref:uncharacterized protein C20orf96 homolog n=1 Tax=Paroedura picta TaxID=143630 RepID=UPI004056FC5C